MRGKHFFLSSHLWIFWQKKFGFYWKGFLIMILNFTSIIRILHISASESHDKKATCCFTSAAGFFEYECYGHICDSSTTFLFALLVHWTHKKFNFNNFFTFLTLLVMKCLYIVLNMNENIWNIKLKNPVLVQLSGNAPGQFDPYINYGREYF